MLSPVSLYRRCSRDVEMLLSVDAYCWPTISPSICGSSRSFQRSDFIMSWHNAYATVDNTPCTWADFSREAQSEVIWRGGRSPLWTMPSNTYLLICRTMPWSGCVVCSTITNMPLFWQFAIFKLHVCKTICHINLVGIARGMTAATGEDEVFEPWESSAP